MHRSNFLTLLVALFLTMLTISSAQADSTVESAFKRLTGATSTSTSAGYYQSQVRNTFTGGSGSIRFRTATPVKAFGINVTPPDVSVGCSGIDWHLGGISWVNSVKIKQMLQGMIQGATMYVVQMALNALCEDCASEIDSVMDAIRQVTGKEMDSCQLGHQLAQKSFSDASKALCKNVLANKNITDSQADGRGQCSVQDAGFALGDQGWFKPVKDASTWAEKNCAGGVISCFSSLASKDQDVSGQSEQQKDNANMIGQVNLTWRSLQNRGLVLDAHDIEKMSKSGLSQAAILARANAGYAMGELMMSMTGVYYGDTSGTARHLAPSIPPTKQGVNQALGTIMCGEAYFNGDYHGPKYSGSASESGLSAEGKSIVRNECNRIFGVPQSEGGSRNTPDASTMSITSCYNAEDSGVSLSQLLTTSPAANGELSSDYNKCLPSTPKIGDKGKYTYDFNQVPMNQWFKRSYVKNTIGVGTLALSVGMMENILNKIVNSTPLNPGKPFTDEEIAFIQQAPFPLYKIINQAAIFPAMRSQIVTDYAPILGLMMARQFMLNYIQDSSSFANSQGESYSSEKLQQLSLKIEHKMGEINKNIDGSLDQISETFNRAALIRSRIMQTEQQLRESVFARNLMGNEQFVMDTSSARAAGDANGFSGNGGN